MKQCPECECVLAPGEFYKNTSQADGLSSYCKCCCIARASRWRKANPERNRQHQARWDARHPGATVVRGAVGTARKYGSPGRGVTIEEWRSHLDEAMGLCVYCHRRAPLTMDHIEALSRGGEHSAENVTAACGSCNSSKGDKPLIVWLAMRRAA